MNKKHSFKKIGAPAGNQNARKHGFYSRLLDEAERKDYDQAVNVEGIDEEIALLRVKIKSVLRNDPDNIKLIGRAAETLGRLLRTKYHIGKNDKKGLKEAVATVFKDIALPLGIGAGTIINRINKG